MGHFIKPPRRAGTAHALAGDRSLLRGLVGCWPFWDGSGYHPADISGNGYHLGEKGAGVSLGWAATPHGIASDCTGVNGVSSWYRTGVSRTPIPLTLFSVFRQDNAQSSILFSHDAAGNDGLRLHISAGGNMQFVLGGVAAYTYSGLTVNLDELYGMILTVDANNGTAAIYLYNYSTGDYQTESKSIGTLSGTPTQIQIGGLTWHAANVMAGQIGFTAWWDHVKTEAEAARIFMDPYALITPTRRRGVPSGASTVAATWAEGAAAGDTFTTVATLLATLAEGASAGDADTNIATLLDSLIDGAVAGDTQAVTAVLLAAMAEGASAGESWAITMTTALAMSDGSVAGDTFAGTVLAGIVTASIAEGSKASDLFGNALTALAGLSEGASAGDTMSLIATLGAVISEGGSAGDTMTAIGTYGAGLAEGAQAGDAWTGTVPGNIVVAHHGVRYPVTYRPAHEVAYRPVHATVTYRPLAEAA